MTPSIISKEVLQHPPHTKPTHFMWVRILTHTQGSTDGKTLRNFNPGERHELPAGPAPQHDLALELIKAGFAEECEAPEDQGNGPGKPPTVEFVMSRGYGQEAAEKIVAEEQRKFEAGEKPYGDKEPAKPEAETKNESKGEPVTDPQVEAKSETEAQAKQEEPAGSANPEVSAQSKPEVNDQPKKQRGK